MATLWNPALGIDAPRATRLGNYTPAALLGPGWPAWSWMLILLLVGTDALLLALTPVSLTPQSWAVVAAIAFGAGGLLLLGRRIDPCYRLRTFISASAIALVCWPALRLLNYIAMASALPLRDDEFAAADRALGLDWFSYLSFLDAHPALIRAMGGVYGNLSHYSCFAFLLLLLTRGSERARDFVLLFLITAVATIVIGMLVPAAGAMVHYAPGPGALDFIPPSAGADSWPPFAAMRADPAQTLDLMKLAGLVAFPSFHTAMGVVMIWCSRGGRGLFLPSLTINLLMIASTPLFGGHYFVDVIAGAALALGAAWALARFKPELP